MSKLKHAKGNLINMAENGEFDAILQGCNCFCTMGSGIAKEIRERYPSAYASDCMTQSGDIAKLGNWTISPSSVDNPSTKFAILNCYTQFGFNRGGSNDDVFEYTAFKLILQKLAHLYGTKRFGLPFIGTGLAGGDKKTIMELIEDFAEEVDSMGGTVTLVEFSA
jgi:O-acetyl-ADP-ribose deacetylase (regulator of RNase III)